MLDRVKTVLKTIYKCAFDNIKILLNMFLTFWCYIIRGLLAGSRASDRGNFPARGEQVWTQKFSTILEGSTSFFHSLSIFLVMFCEMESLLLIINE